MMIRRKKGIKLGRKLIRVFKWVTRKRRKAFQYNRLKTQTSASRKKKAIYKLCEWGKSFKQGLFSTGRRSYIPVGHDRDFYVPKGHLAIYVGEKDGDIRRVVVPVLFLNHPLFEKLLKDAEDVYGFNHAGQITIPCPISEFEHVQTRIATREKLR